MLSLLLLPFWWLVSASGRDWLIAQAQQSLQSHAYTLTYSQSSGNTVQGLGLLGVSLRGPGVDLYLERLDVGYNLLHLVTWRLPLVIRASGLAGALEPGNIVLPEPARPLLPPPQLTVAQLELGEVALQLGGTSYRLPDLALGGVSVQSEGGGLGVRGVLTGADGAASFDARMQLAPFDLTMTFEADARLARHYWDGVEAGTVTGTVYAGSDGVRADLALEEGRANLIGIAMQDVAGTARYHHPQLEGRLVGRALGGEVEAHGTVDIAAAHWQAEVEGRPGLQEAVQWLAQERLPFDPALLGLDGDAATTLHLSGWRHIDLQGQALGQGTALGQALHALEATFGYSSSHGTSVEASASLEAGELQLSLSPQRGGYRMSASARELALVQLEAVELTVNADAAFAATHDGVAGDLSVQGRGSVLGRALDYWLAGQLHAGQWQASGELQDELGGLASASLELGDTLQAALDLEGLELPWLQNAARARLVVTGPPDVASWTLQLAGMDGPLHPLLNGTGLEQDLSGNLVGTLSGGVLDLVGRLGPLALAGDYDLVTRQGTLALALEPVSLPVTLSELTGTLAVPEANLFFSGSTLSAAGQVVARGIGFSAVQLADLRAPFSLALEDGRLAVALVDERRALEFSYLEDTLRLALQELPVAVAGADWTLSGTIGRTERFTVDLLAEAPAGRMSLQGDATEAVVALSLAPGFRAGSLRLAQAVSLRGPVRIADQVVALAGTAGEVELSLRAGFAERWHLEGALQVADQRLTASLAEGGWHLVGRLPLPPLLAVVSEAPVAGELELDLRRDAGQTSGSGLLELTAWGQALRGRLEPSGDALLLSLAGAVLEAPFELSGPVFPLVTLEGRLGELGSLQLHGPYGALELHGEGLLPAQTLGGLSVEALPWRAQLSAATGRAQIELGASRAAIDIRGDEWTLDGSLDLPARFQALDLHLQANLSREAVLGTLRLQHPAAATVLALSGPLEAVQVEGRLPPALGEALVGVILPALELSGTVDLLQARYAFEALGVEAVGDSGFKLALEGQGVEPRAALEAEGLRATLDVQTGAWQVALEAFDPAAWMPHWPLADPVTGNLQYDPDAQRYTGELLGGQALQLQGAGPQLLLALELPYRDALLYASGALLPELMLDVRASYPGWAVLEGSLAGHVLSPHFSGEARLVARELAGGLSWPAQHKAVTASWHQEDGLDIRLVSEDGVARFDGERWAGLLPLSLHLQGERHALEGALSGSLAAPQWQGRVSGRHLAGDLRLAPGGGSASLELDAGSWLPAFGEARLAVQAVLESGGAWRLELQGEAVHQSLPALAVTASLSGQGLGSQGLGSPGHHYQGSGTLELAGESLSLALAGEGQEATLELQVAGLDASAFHPGADAWLAGSATLQLGAAGWQVEAATRLEGLLSGQPLALELGGSQRALELGGELLGGTVTATFDLEALSGGARFMSPERGLELEATLRNAQGALDLDARGSLQGEALVLRGSYSLAGAAGSWSARYGASYLSGGMQLGEGSTFDAVGYVAEGPGFDLALEAALRGGELRLLFGTLSSDDFSLTLAGALWPLELEGSLSAPFLLEPLQLRVQRQPSAYLLQAEQPAGRVALELAPSLAPLRASLQGQLALPVVALTGDLTWTAVAGFAGWADARSEPATDSRVSVSASGDGPLQVQASWQHGGREILTLALNLAANPWLQRELAGTLSLSGLSTALLSWPVEESRLTGQLDLSGTVSDPHLSGPVQLTGALSGSGTVSGSPAGLQLALEGEGFAASAELTPAAWELRASLRELDLAGLTPLTTVLSADVVATQAFGERLQLQIADVEASNLLRGALYYDGAWTGNLELGAALADLLDLPVQGTIRGPLTLDSDRLTATLEVSELRSGAQPWALSGRADLSGSLADPQLRLALQGSESASGALEATWRPQAGELGLSSTLALVGITTDLWLTLEAGTLAAGGQLGWRDFSAVLTAEGEHLRLVGEGQLEGWQAQVDPQVRNLQLTGGLASLADGAAGSLSLVAAWPSEVGQWLTGSLREVSYQGASLGDLELAAWDERLTLTGDGLAASLQLGEAFAWSLELVDRELYGLSLSAAGEGDASAGTLSAALEAGGAQLPLRLSYGEDELQLQAEGALPAFTVSARAVYRESRWHGPLQLHALGGAALVAGELSGGLWTPQLDAQVTLEHPQGRLDADLRLSAAALEVAGTVSSPLVQEAVGVRGTLWPELALALSAGSQRLEWSAEGAAGSLELGVGPLQLALAGQSDASLLVQVAGRDQPQSGLQARLPGQLQGLSSLPFVAYGAASGSGQVSFEGAPSLELHHLALPFSGGGAEGSLTLNGFLRFQDGPQGELSLEAALAQPFLPWLEQDPVRLNAEFSGEQAVLTVGHAALSGSGKVDWRSGLALELDLAVAAVPGAVSGGLELRVAYDPASGPLGTLTLQSLPLLRGAALSAELDLSPQQLSGSGVLLAPEGRLSASGELGWGALGLTFPASSDSTQLRFRLDAFNLANLPLAEALLPELDAPMTGVAQVVNGAVFGQIVSPNLQVAGRPLPLTVDLSGSLGAIEAHVQQDRSHASLSYAGGRVTGFVQLEGFPLHTLFEASLGPTDVESSVTGLLRFELPLADPAAANLRFASERLRLERAGVVTEGELAFRYDLDGFVLDQATFRGAGSFHATGGVSAQGADLSLAARDADFGPLLGLLPALRDFGLGARGSLDLQLRGSLEAPDLSLTSARLDLAVAGLDLALTEADLQLERGSLRGSSRLEGLGSLDLVLEGSVSFAPFALGGQLGFAGAFELPTIGRLEGVQGRITVDATGASLESRATLGAPVTLSGTFSPLDLRLRGVQLALAVPQYYLHSSLFDADLRLRYQDAFVLSGQIFAHAARLGFAETPAEVVMQAAPSNPLLERLHFENLRLQAPQQLTFRENLGTADLSLDLTLFGTAAAPALQGQATVQRGSLRFSGREFSITQADATFDPLRGPYPYLRARAVTTFEKSRVLSAAQARTVLFAAPQEGRTFQVVLELEGDFVETAPGRFHLRLEPRLSSDALIEDRRAYTPAPELDYAGAPGVRPLTEEEMVALLALGRLEYNLDLSQGLLADGVAQTAIDTVIDLYVMAELQRAIGEALGLELFEIRTTALSSLLEDSGSEFALSLRMGTYITDDVFATFSLGSYYDASQSHVLGSSFSLRYDLSPLELQLSGGLTVPTSGLDSRLTGPSPSFSVDFGYHVSEVVSLGAGFDVSGGLENRFGVRLGLDFRW